MKTLMGQGLRVVSILLALALCAQGIAGRKLPLPDSSWRPIVAAEDGGAPSSLVDVKRAASRAHQQGEARVSAVVSNGNGPQLLLAWGANRLLFTGTMPTTSGGARSSDLPGGDELTRASWFNGQGKPVRQILLLESRLGASLPEIMESLIAWQRDFDVADAALLTSQAAVLASEDADGELRLGNAVYPVVLVCPSDYWPEEALDVLQSFIRAHGKVIFAGRQPLSIQRLLLRTGVVRVSELPEDLDRALSYAITGDVHILTGTGAAVRTIRYQHRVDGQKHYFFLLNSGADSVSVVLGLGVAGVFEEWDLRAGRARPIERPQMDIPAGASVAIVVDTAAKRRRGR